MMIDGPRASVACSRTRAHPCWRSRRSCQGRRLRSRQSVACSRTIDREAAACVFDDQVEQRSEDAAVYVAMQPISHSAIDRPAHLDEGTKELQVHLFESASTEAPLQVRHDVLLDHWVQFCKNTPVDSQCCESGIANSSARLCEDIAEDPPLQSCGDAAAAAAAAFLRRIAPSSPPRADVAAAAAAAFLRRVESRKEASICGTELLMRKRLNTTLPATDRRSRRRVRFDLTDVQAHEVVPYEEIYGLHPREFVFGKGFHMIPAGGDHGFVDFLTVSRRADGVEFEDIEDSDTSNSDQSDDCHDDGDMSDEDLNGSTMSSASARAYARLALTR